MKLSEIANLSLIVSDEEENEHKSLPKALTTLKDLLTLEDPLSYMPYYWAQDRSTYKKEFGAARRSPLHEHIYSILAEIEETKPEHPGSENISQLFQYAPLFPCYSSFAMFLYANENEWATPESAAKRFVELIDHHPNFVWNGKTLSTGIFDKAIRNLKVSNHSKIFSFLDAHREPQTLGNGVAHKGTNLLGSCLNAKDSLEGCIYGVVLSTLTDRYDGITNLPKPTAGLKTAQERQDLYDALKNTILETDWSNPYGAPVVKSKSKVKATKPNWDHLIMDI